MNIILTAVHLSIFQIMVFLIKLSIAALLAGIITVIPVLIIVFLITIIGGRFR